MTRWLGETGKKIKKLILVAPAIVNKRKEYWELEKFYDFKINFGIKERVEEIILIESDNDGEGILESGKIYSRELKVKPIILHKRGHFTERGMGTREFPELLEKIIE